MRRKTYVNGVEGISVGGSANVFFNLDRRLHVAEMFLTGRNAGDTADLTLASEIVESLQITVNGVTILDATPAELQKIYRLNKKTVNDLMVPIPFAEIWRLSPVAQESTSWDLYNQSSMTMQVNFKSGITSPTMKVRQSYDFNRNTVLNPLTQQNESFLSIVKRRPITFNAAAGTNDITTIPTTFPITRIYLQPSSGTIDFVEIYRDGEKIFEATKAQNIADLTAMEIDPTQFEFPILFDADQQLNNALVVNNNLLIRTTNSASGSVRMLVESRANGYI